MKNKRTSFTVSQEEFNKWEEIMFQERCRSISAFIRQCVDFYIKEKYDKAKLLTRDGNRP